MSQPIVIVDAFTAAPFRGNPAAVCVLPAPAAEAWMQALATEMNLSETAFITRREDGFTLRWFTPAAEVDLCGHATLAASHVLWEEGHVAPDGECRFHTRSGWLTALKSGDTIEMTFPNEASQPIPVPAGLSEALGIPVTDARCDRLRHVLIEVAGESIVRTISPDFNLLRSLPYNAYMVTARSDSGEFDFVSRFFAPAFGINEDPVTGSAHCALGPYWGDKLGKNMLRACQASSRGGVLTVTVEPSTVRLAGQAVTIVRGQLAESALPGFPR